MAVTNGFPEKEFRRRFCKNQTLKRKLRIRLSKQCPKCGGFNTETRPHVTDLSSGRIGYEMALEKTKERNTELARLLRKPDFENKRFKEMLEASGLMLAVAESSTNPVEDALNSAVVSFTNLKLWNEFVALLVKKRND